MTEIRPLQAGDDFTAAGRVLEESWKHSYRGILPQSYLDRLSPERFSAAMRAEPEMTLVLFEQDTPLGVCTLGFSRQRPGAGEVIALYVLPKRMGEGFGRRLLNAAEEALQREGCEEICLWVFSSNQNAIAFYQHMGFALTGNVQWEIYAGEKIEMLEMLCRNMV